MAGEVKEGYNIAGEPFINFQAGFSKPFHVVSDYGLAGDQGEAVEKLYEGYLKGDRAQTLKRNRHLCSHITRHFRHSFTGSLNLSSLKTLSLISCLHTIITSRRRMFLEKIFTLRRKWISMMKLTD